MASYIIIYVTIWIISIGNDFNSFKNKDSAKLKIAAICLLIFFLGFRDGVGGDWGNYLGIFYKTEEADLLDLLFKPDSGFLVINKLLSLTGGSVHAVNFVCASVAMICLHKFLAKTETSYWVVLCYALSYLVFVVFIGYTRQACAIAICMYGLVVLLERKVITFLVVVTIAATFHRSAVIFYPLCLIVTNNILSKKIFLLFLAFLAVSTFFIYPYRDLWIQGYLKSSYASAGALYRLLLNALFGFIYLFLLAGKGVFGFYEHRLCKILSVASIILLIIYPLFPSSTALDRIGLYLIPLHLMVVVGCDAVFRSVSRVGELAFRESVRFFGFFYLYIWLTYAPNAASWIPYDHTFRW